MEQFKVDLSNCDREPIHIPGKIQSHGFLIAFTPETGVVEFASNNLESFLGTGAANILGKHIAQVLTGNQTKLGLTSNQLDKILAELADEHKAESITSITCNGQPYYLLAHNSHGLVVLEFEPRQIGDDAIKPHNSIGDIINPMQEGLSLAELLPLLAKHIKRIIGYDRVMVYKYWDDWHGEVVAEERNDNLEPFLGLHYPASDIPKQARELYLANMVRIIADVDATPASLLPNRAMGDPLDLTHSSLRAVSPMHIQYLQNMGVKASFSISLVYKGKLWGLIACHNYSPKFIDHDSRQTCKLLAQVLSTTLNVKVEEEQVQTSSAYKEEADSIFETLYSTGNVPESLINNAGAILRMGNAKGAALTFEGQTYTIGDTPTTEQIEGLAGWLAKNAPNPLYQTNTLPKFYPKAASFSAQASGVLAIELFRSNGEYLMWFKPEINQTVKWAGNPQKPIEVDASGATRLTPRQSFAVWYEEVKHTSAPWEAAEMQTAVWLREGILQVISQKANEVRKLNEKLKEAYDELDTFSHTISHDLRSPLAVIKNYTEILHEELTETSAEEAKAMLQRIISSADHMESLITDVLAYSRLSKVSADNVEALDMGLIINELVQQAKISSPHFEKTTINIQATPPLKAPKVLIKQVFGNLIENAIKYSALQPNPQVTITGQELANETLYTITDNGIGIDTTQGDKVFMLFKRMDNATGYEGTGIGLATVKRLIRKLGGRVWFESELNKGTSFFVTFPLIITDEESN